MIKKNLGRTKTAKCSKYCLEWIEEMMKKAKVRK